MGNHDYAKAVFQIEIQLTVIGRNHFESYIGNKFIVFSCQQPTRKQSEHTRKTISLEDCGLFHCMKVTVSLNQ